MENKRTLSGPQSEEKPEKKKTKQDEPVEDSLLEIDGNDLFEEVDDTLLETGTEDMATGQGDINDTDTMEASGNNEDKFATPGSPPEKGEKSKPQLKPPQNTSVGLKRPIIGGNKRESKKTKKSEKSEFLLTIFGPGGGNLLRKLNDDIFALIAEEGQAYIPRVNFTKVQGDKTLVGCDDEGSALWIRQKAMEFDASLEIWDRNSLSIYHTYIPYPTALKPSQEIVRAIQFTNGIPGRILPLKTEDTKNGRVLIVGMTDTAANYVELKGGAVFCGLAKVTFTRAKAKKTEESGVA